MKDIIIVCVLGAMLFCSCKGSREEGRAEKEVQVTEIETESDNNPSIIRKSDKTEEMFPGGGCLSREEAVRMGLD